MADKEKSQVKTPPAPTGDQAAYSVFETVYYDYMRRLAEVRDETTKQLMDAQRKLSELRLDPSDVAAAQAAQDAAQREYVDAVRVAWDASQKNYTDAYNQYLGGYRDAWSKIDLPTLSPPTLAMVAQSAISAGSYAGMTIGNCGPIAWAGVPPWALSLVRP